MSLTSAWVIVEPTRDDQRNPFPMGLGVTGWDEHDIRRIVAADAIKGRDLVITAIKIPVKYDELERLHVRKNMGVMIERGIWFPKGQSNDQIIRA